MNFELETLFRFQKTLVEMQSVCVGIQDKSIREAAIHRVDTLLEIYKTFDKFYYSAHSANQRAGKLTHDLIEAGKQIEALKAENEKLLKSIQWPA